MHSRNGRAKRFSSPEEIREEAVRNLKEIEHSINEITQRITLLEAQLIEMKKGFCIEVLERDNNKSSDNYALPRSAKKRKVLKGETPQEIADEVTEVCGQPHPSLFH